MRKLSGKDVELNSISSDKVFFFNKNVLMFCLFLQENLCYGYFLVLPRQSTLNKYPQLFFAEKKEKYITYLKV